MELTGNYQSNKKYDIFGNIENLELNNLYSIIGKASRINGLIKFATIDIDNNNQINPIYSATINMKDGAIDDIQFDQLNMRSIYQNRRLLIDSLTVDTHLGNINGFGWLNIGISDKIGLFQNEDKFNMNFTYKNVNIEQFNRYLPWGYESRGFMTGSIDVKGTAAKPEIISYMDILKPGFDKIDVRKNGEKQRWY